MLLYNCTWKHKKEITAKVSYNFLSILAIEDYMRSQVGPSSKIKSSLKAVTDFMKERDDVVIMGFFKDENDSLLEQYLEANNDIRDDYNFAHTFDATAKKHFGITESSVVMFQPEKFRSKYEDKHIVFKVNKNMSLSKIDSFKTFLILWLAEIHQLSPLNLKDVCDWYLMKWRQ